MRGTIVFGEGGWIEEWEGMEFGADTYMEDTLRSPVASWSDDSRLLLKRSGVMGRQARGHARRFATRHGQRRILDSDRLE